jgi:surface protein
MAGIFMLAVNFNQPIGNWNMSKVTRTNYMFCATKFNRDINDWDVSNVVNMSGMFYKAKEFNQPLDKWANKTGKVTNMQFMFQNAEAFTNHDLSKWDVSSIKLADDHREFMLDAGLGNTEPNWK